MSISIGIGLRTFMLLSGEMFGNAQNVRTYSRIQFLWICRQTNNSYNRSCYNKGAQDRGTEQENFIVRNLVKSISHKN